MRPKADSLGEKAPAHLSGLKGRKNLCRDQLNFGFAELLSCQGSAGAILFGDARFLLV